MEIDDILKKIENTKFLITKLTEVQSLYYETLRDDIGVMIESEDWLFDYIYNVKDESFEEFLERYNLKIGDIIDE
jgi:hypothetical protein